MEIYEGRFGAGGSFNEFMELLSKCMEALKPRQVCPVESQCGTGLLTMKLHLSDNIRQELENWGRRGSLDSIAFENSNEALRITYQIGSQRIASRVLETSCTPESFFTDLQVEESDGAPGINSSMKMMWMQKLKEVGM